MSAQLNEVPTEIFVGGEFIPARSSSRFSVRSPSNGRVIAEVADAGVDDARLALEAAAKAQQSFGSSPPRQRSEMLRRAFDSMLENRTRLARLIVEENGKALSDAVAEVTYAAEFFRWYSEEAVRIRGDLGTAPSGTNRILVYQQPVGVSLLVTPWNFPAAMLTRKIGPAIAAGCAVIAKPAEETPLTALAIAEILHQAGVPGGVVNVLPTSQPESLVSNLLADTRIRMLSFTGSTEVGRHLLRQAADHVVKCSMELGGNAPFFVFADADLDAAVDGALIAKLRNGGQACTSANRFYVEESVAAEFGRRLAARMGSLRVGPGLQEDVEVGPLINDEAVQRVSALVDDAVKLGATVLLGGQASGGPGSFYPPTVLVDVPPGAAIVGREIFGPVATIISFASESEAIQLANDSEYGLASYCYTADLARGLRVAERLECGMVGINRGLISDPAAPFGGTKQSGLGREGGRHGIEEFLETKYVALDW